MRGMARLLMIGWGTSLTVLPASEPEVVWPTE